jgi:branched-chain amino acid transport system substrate-binding protein
LSNPVKKTIGALAVAGVALASGTAGAQVKIGVIVSATGPAASLGIPEKNTIAMCPKTIGGKSVDYIVQDDATDTTNAVQVAKKLTSENGVDAIIGTSTTPAALAMLDVIADSETPTISLASSIRIIDPVDAKRTWMFKTPQTDVMMAGAIVEHMTKTGVKSIGYVGFNDALGEAFFAEVDKAAKTRGVPLVANERYAPKDTSVVGQTLKVIAAKPDAVIIGASGTPAALPARTLVEHGYKGKLYFNHGVANNDFLRVGGKDVEGAFVPASPVIAASQLSDNHPSKKIAQEYVHAYEAANGAGSVAAFGSYAWDACLELASAIPQALKSAEPGTKEFRRALRDALESIKDLGVTNGVVTMSKTDHLGLDNRARVMVQIKDGKWVLQPP